MGLLDCKQSFSNILVAICRTIRPFPFSQIYVSVPKQKETHCITFTVRRVEFAFFPMWGHFASKKSFSIGLCWKWGPPTWCPKSTSPIIWWEICKRLATVWVMHSSHLPSLFGLVIKPVYWSRHFPFLAHEKYIAIA